MRASEGIAAGINEFARMLKVVTLAAVSAVVGLLFMLSIYRQQQVQQKRRAFRYAGRDLGGRLAVLAAHHADVYSNDMHLKSDRDGFWRPLRCQ
jgi:hypothetical protein